MPSIRHGRTFGSVLAIAAVALAGTAYADASDRSSHSQERTIRLVQTSEAPDLTVVDLGKPGLSAGDHVVLTDGLARENGAPAGEFSQECTVTVPRENLFTSTSECSGSLVLEEGTITVDGPFVPALPEQTQAVTGGTGKFRTAQGVVVARAEDDQIVVRLAR